MEIDHIGYAVKNIEKSIDNFSNLGYKFGEIIKDEKRHIYICFGTLGDIRIELCAPFRNVPSPVDEWVKKNGCSPYHVCYISEHIEEDIQVLEQKRYKIIVPLEEACAFGGKRVVFMYNLSVGIIEIVEK